MDLQPHRRWGHYHRHTLWGYLIYYLHPRSNDLLQLPISDTPSILTRRIIRYLTCSDATFAHSLRSLIALFPSVKNLGQIPVRLRSGVHSALEGFDCIPAIAGEVEHIPLAAVVASSTQIFGDIPIDWDICRTDVRCISWVLDSTTDTDVIFSTVWFAADMIWYPEIVGALSPHILADHFLDCLLDGRVIPGKSGHASSIGMALASVLSTHLSMQPGNQALQNLCIRIRDSVGRMPSSDPTFVFVTAVLRFAVCAPAQVVGFELFMSVPRHLPTMHQFWLSRIMLQVIWRGAILMMLPRPSTPLP